MVSEFYPLLKWSLRVLTHIRDANRSKIGGGGRRRPKRDEGILGLYKGLSATLLGVGPIMMQNDSPVLVSLACGILSTIASSIATFPLDLVRQRKELEEAGGRARVYTTDLFCTFKYIIRTEGFRGLYRGFLLEYYKAVPGVVAITSGLYRLQW
ncbi:hypothetical protein CUMW_066560 [Citrus unshiu]|nr:hypothetical protein CUMW_066560 [Citrus unshiu]